MKLINQLKGYSCSCEDTGSDEAIRIGGKDLWIRHFLDTKRRNVSSRHVRKSHNMYSNGTMVMSGADNVVAVFTIDSLPNLTSIRYKEDLRDLAQDGVRVSFISKLTPTVINWQGAQVKSKIRTWKSMDEESEEVTSYNMIDNMGSSDGIAWRRKSLEYLADADVRRRRKLMKYRTLVLVEGIRGESFDKTIQDIHDYATKTAGIKMTWVSEDVGNYLEYFSPYSQSNQKLERKIGNSTVPDEVVSRFNCYNQGKIGREGDYWGTDIESSFPVFKQVRKNVVDAENILIAGETGSGKSFFVKCLAVQLLANPRIRGTIMDVEGFEYLPIAYYMSNWESVVILNMGEGTGKYFDPVEIIVTGDKKIDEEMFSMSKSFTLTILRTLLGKEYDKNSWLGIIVNNAVSLTYSKRGVTEDNSTWLKSKGLTLFSVYEEMKEMYKDEVAKKEGVDKFKDNEGYKDALDRVIAALSAYFEPFEKGGTRCNVFQERVTLDDIRDAKLVICSYGMAGKTENSVDPVQMALTQISAANITHLRSMFANASGCYNFKIWEEFQRQGKFPNAKSIVSTALTGGRKLGDINFIITNRLQELLDGDEFGIFGNTTSFAIGSIDDAKTRKEVCERLSIEPLQDSLDRIVLDRGGNETFSDTAVEKRSKYDKAFLIKLDKSVVTMTRMDFPDSVAKSQLFRTGDVDMMEKGLDGDLVTTTTAEDSSSDTDSFDFDHFDI